MAVNLIFLAMKCLGVIFQIANYVREGNSQFTEKILNSFTDEIKVDYIL